MMFHDHTDKEQVLKYYRDGLTPHNTNIARLVKRMNEADQIAIFNEISRITDSWIDQLPIETIKKNIKNTQLSPNTCCKALTMATAICGTMAFILKLYTDIEVTSILSLTIPPVVSSFALILYFMQSLSRRSNSEICLKYTKDIQKLKRGLEILKNLNKITEEEKVVFATKKQYFFVAFFDVLTLETADIRSTNRFSHTL